MRALIFDGTSLQLDTRYADPSPGPGDAIVRTRRAGVSRTDYAVCRGLFDHRGVLGHEFVGEVEAVSDSAHAKLVGRRVVGSVGIFCGRCQMCQSGLSQHCRERRLLGMQGQDGCFADRFCIPAANLVPVPDSVDDDHAVFAEPLASALQAVRQLTIEGRPFITVLGDGPVGLLMVQIMARLNATVRLVGRHATKTALCEKWGVKHRLVTDVGRRADQDIVVDCTGSPNGLDVALSMARPRGKILLKTLIPSAPDATHVDLTPVVVNELSIVGSHRGPTSEAVALLARNDVDVVSLISRRTNLEDLPALLGAGTDAGTVKTLVQF